MALLANRDLAFLHRLEQRRLNLGRRPVDLVGEQQVAKDRAEFGGEVAATGVVDPRADQVGGHQVRSELDPAGGAADDLGEGFDGDGFRQAGHAFEQDMALSQQRDQQPLQQPVLTYDQAFDLEQDLFDRRRNAGGQLARRLGGARAFRLSQLRSVDHGVLPGR